MYALRKLKHALILILSALAVLPALSSAVHAAPVNAALSWTAPTTRVDGTPLAASEIAEYRIYSGVASDAWGVDKDSPHMKVTSGTSQVVTIELTPRAEPYVLQFAARAVDTKGNVSPLSNIASTTVLVESTAEPGAPTTLQFTIDCAAGCVITEVK
jgi:hypothetical protein